VTVQQCAKSIGIKQEQIKEKSFEQKNFLSSLWQTMVAFQQKPNAELQKAVNEAMNSEHIDLLILVSHQKDNFQRFLSNNMMQLVFQHHIPVLVFQAEKGEIK